MFRDVTWTAFRRILVSVGLCLSVLPRCAGGADKPGPSTRSGAQPTTTGRGASRRGDFSAADVALNAGDSLETVLRTLRKAFPSATGVPAEEHILSGSPRWDGGLLLLPGAGMTRSLKVDEEGRAWRIGAVVCSARGKKVIVDLDPDAKACRFRFLEPVPHGMVHEAGAYRAIRKGETPPPGAPIVLLGTTRTELARRHLVSSLGMEGYMYLFGGLYEQSYLLDKTAGVGRSALIRWDQFTADVGGGFVSYVLDGTDRRSVLDGTMLSKIERMWILTESRKGLRITRQGVVALPRFTPAEAKALHEADMAFLKAESARMKARIAQLEAQAARRKAGLEAAEATEPDMPMAKAKRWVGYQQVLAVQEKYKRRCVAMRARIRATLRKLGMAGTPDKNSRGARRQTAPPRPTTRPRPSAASWPGA